VEIAQGLAQVLRLDAVSRAALGKAGQTQVRAEFTLERMVEGLLGVYEELA
jgi:glycosyltransferase involved in cell wall biosynthesis